MKKYLLKDFTLDPQGKISKRMIFQDKNVIAFVLNIAQGASLPNHTHFECTLLIQVLQGEADVIVDNAVVQLKNGELLQLDGPENMAVNNTGQGTLQLFVTISPAPPAEHYAKDVDF